MNLVKLDWKKQAPGDVQGGRAGGLWRNGNGKRNGKRNQVVSFL